MPGWQVSRIQEQVMHASRWAQVWMMLGLLWFLLAIAFAPTNKIYQQGLTLFLWLPAMVFAWSLASDSRPCGSRSAGSA